MLRAWLTALRVLLQEAWSTRRDAHIRFLRLQVEMMKERLPGNRVILDRVERRRLLVVGAEKRPNYLAVEQKRHLLTSRSVVKLPERPTIPARRGRPEAIQDTVGAATCRPAGRSEIPGERDRPPRWGVTAAAWLLGRGTTPIPRAE